MTLQQIQAVRGSEEPSGSRRGHTEFTESIECMRKKYFYTHIIDTSVLSLELGDMELTPKERIHLIALIDSNIHHEILDLILSELTVLDKKIFLSHLASQNHDKIWKFLNEKIEDIEEKIKKTAHFVREELHRDIKEAKKIT